MRSVKQGVLWIIEAWQENPDRPRGMCLHTPTCSVYGHQAISRYGVFRGGIMTAWRVFRCNRCLTPHPPAPPAEAGTDTVQGMQTEGSPPMLADGP